ncbi:DUF6030 family protein [Roseibium sp. M-1]
MEDTRHDKDMRSARQPKARSSGPRWADDAAEPVTSPRKAAPSVPGHPTSRASFLASYYLWGALALIIASATIGGTLWHFRQGADVEEVAIEQPLPDPLQPLPEITRTALLNPKPELAAELKRAFLGQPDALCTELGSLGLENPGWRRAPFQTKRWQCASELVPLTTPSVDYGPTTLFFLLRGPSETKIDYLRLKLVVEDPKQKQIGLEAVWLVIDALAGRYGWTVPEDFRTAISGFAKLETSHRGVRLSVAPEDPKLTGDARASRRLNIILDFGEPDLIRPSDRFEQAPPLESGWTITAPDGREGE